MPPQMIKGLVSKLTNVREWLENRETFGAVLIVAIGLLVRLWAATDTFLDPDEALHYMQANQTSLQLAYKASLNVVHPPLHSAFRHFRTDPPPPICDRWHCILLGSLQVASETTRPHSWLDQSHIFRLLTAAHRVFCRGPPVCAAATVCCLYPLFSGTCAGGELCRNDVALIGISILGDAISLLSGPVCSSCWRIRLSAHRESAPFGETRRYMGDRPTRCVGTLVGLLRYTHFKAGRKWFPCMDAEFLYPSVLL